MKTINILGIETSCDETAAAIVSGRENGAWFDFKLGSSVLSSSLSLHKKTGGIVPEVAARKQAEVIIPTVKIALLKARIRFGDISAIAVTVGPGLVGSLLVGIETAKTFSFSLDIPIIPINHLEGHLFANFILMKKKERKEVKFPGVALLVSGGHTILVLMKNFGGYQVIGETLDDAAGEAFDKVAKLLGLPFPGGPAISAEAEKCKMQNAKCKISLPRPMIDSEDSNFSFSGLKTAVLYHLHPPCHSKKRKQRPSRGLPPTKGEKVGVVAKEFQQAVADVLAKKTFDAAKKHKARSILLSGGVAANELLRKTIKNIFKKNTPEIKVYLPRKKFCTDNAAMVALVGADRYLKKQVKNWYDVRVGLNPEL